MSDYRPRSRPTILDADAEMVHGMTAAAEAEKIRRVVGK